MPVILKIHVSLLTAEWVYHRNLEATGGQKVKVDLSARLASSLIPLTSGVC